MTILGQSQPILLSVITWIIIFLVPVSLLAAYVLRIHRARAVVGPDRLNPREPAWPVALALAVGFTVWFGTQVFYFSLRSLPGVRGTTAPAVPYVPNGADWAFLSTVPAALGFAMLWLTDLAGGPALAKQLGLSARKFPAGVANGLLAALVVVPPIFVLMEVTDRIYHRLNFVHPMEHDLLKAMGESHTALIRVALIVGAVIGAPLFEEFLFRGHLQTLIHRALVVLTTPRQTVAPPPGGFGVMSPGDTPAQPILPLPAIPVVPLGGAWQTWAAIIFTSCLFALVHPMWMWPPIFALSLGLGYAYERTGNLWANITVHCVFNSISTCMYFMMPHGA